MDGRLGNRKFFGVPYMLNCLLFSLTVSLIYYEKEEFNDEWIQRLCEEEEDSSLYLAPKSCKRNLKIAKILVKKHKKKTKNENKKETKVDRRTDLLKKNERKIFFAGIRSGRSMKNFIKEETDRREKREKKEDYRLNLMLQNRKDFLKKKKKKQLLFDSKQ